MTKDEREFHLEEYRLLKSEMVGLKQQAESIFKYSVVIAASVVAWLSTNELEPSHIVMAWWIPTATTMCCGLLGATYYRRVKNFGEYLQSLENALGNECLGWEKFLPTKLPIFRITYGASWLLLFGFCVYVGYLN